MTDHDTDPTTRRDRPSTDADRPSPDHDRRSTDRDRPDTRGDRPGEDDARRTMADVSHANPDTGESAGRLFNRGPILATDGGVPAATDGGSHDAGDDRGADPEETTERSGDGGSTDDDRSMAGVSHTPPNDSEDANRVFERGEEPRDREE